MRASTFLSVSAVPFGVILSLAQTPGLPVPEAMPVEKADTMFKQYPAWAKRMKIVELARTSRAKTYVWSCDDRTGDIDCRPIPTAS